MSRFTWQHKQYTLPFRWIVNLKPRKTWKTCCVLFLDRIMSFFSYFSQLAFLDWQFEIRLAADWPIENFVERGNTESCD